MITTLLIVLAVLAIGFGGAWWTAFWCAFALLAFIIVMALIFGGGK